MYGKWSQPSNSLTGFPLQLPDVCYSWWVLASLKIIGRLHWIDREKLRSFILACQDEETGGFADRPGDMASTIPWFCSFSLLAGFYDSGPFGCRTSIWSKVCSESFCEFVIKARAYRNFLQYCLWGPALHVKNTEAFRKLVSCIQKWLKIDSMHRLSYL